VKTSVCICMLTYKRPAMLERALLSLAKLQLIANPDVDLQLVLVDNDASGSAESTFLRIRPQIPFEARYVVEKQQGIANARNRALIEASGADFLALIDDDETADRLWIDELVTVQRRYNADVVSGPVTPEYEDAPAWVVQGGFFASRKEETGRQIHFVETNNVLFRGEYARQFRFDLRFNRTSGEDTHFFFQLERAGARMIWAAKANVTELIPKQRTTAAWLIDRAQSDANRYSRARLYLSPGPHTHLERICKAAGALGAGCFLLLTGVVAKHRAVKGLRMISRSVGTTKAVLGSAHTYYKPGQLLR